MKQTARSSNISLNSTNLLKLAKTLPYDAIHQKLDSGSRLALRSLLGSVWCLNRNQRSIGIIIKYFTITERFSRADLSRAMFDKSTDHRNNVMVAQFVFLFVCFFLSRGQRKWTSKLSMLL